MKRRRTIKQTIRRLASQIGRLPSRAERWLAYRTYERYHVIRTDLKPGYYDVDCRLLHGSFSLLSSYVELEISAHIASSGSKERNPIVPGIAYISARIEELKRNKDRSESEDERRNLDRELDFCYEVGLLYSWWKLVRPARPDEYEASGFDAAAKVITDKYGRLFEFVPSRPGYSIMKDNGRGARGA